MTFRLDFGEYRPDIGEADSGHLVVAKNVQATANGYRPVKQPSVYSGALAAAPRGLWLTRKVNGTFKAFAATGVKLYELVSTTWTDRSGAKTFSVPTGEAAHADQFGSKFIVTNYTDGPYVVDVDSGTNFAALGGSPPLARTVAVVEGHVVLGSTNANDYGIAWSDTDDETNWTTGNAGSTVLRRGGRPRKIIAAAALVVQEEGIQRIILSERASTTFEFYELEGQVGTIAPDSVIGWGDSIAYLSRNGFWYRGEPIGHERIARTFFARADDTQIDTVLGAADPLRPYFIWVYRTSSTDTTYTNGFMYNWLLQRWTELEFDAEWIGLSATSAVSMDSWSVSPDSEPLSPDSPVWAGGRGAMATFDTAFKLSFLDGANLEATFELADATVGDIISEQQQMRKGVRAHIRAVRPVMDTNSALADVRVKQRYGDTGSYRAVEASVSNAGYAYLHASGRAFRFKIRIPSGTTWSYAKGIDVIGRRAGRK